MIETAETARAYLAVLLPESRAEELAEAAVEDADASDRVTLLRAAHHRLTAEIRVSDAVAADVLVRELGMTSQEAAGVLDVTTEQVEAAVDEAAAVQEELERGSVAPDADPPPVRYVFDAEAPPGDDGPPGFTDQAPREEPDEPRRSRRAVTVVVGVLVAVAIGVAIATSVSRSSGEDIGHGVSDVAAEITITDSAVTDQMGEDGPGPRRDVFAPDETVIFWFSYEPLEGAADVELALLRDGEELISPTFPLPTGRTDSHVTLPQVVTDDPGTYRVELRRDGRLLAETGFRVEAQ